MNLENTKNFAIYCRMGTDPNKENKKRKNKFKKLSLKKYYGVTYDNLAIDQYRNGVISTKKSYRLTYRSSPDGDNEYLNRCLKYYEDVNIWAMGITEKEENIASKIKDLLEEYNPDIVVITGHDAYYRKRGNENELASYKNSGYFVNAIKEARRFEKSHQKLIIIAGGCQSDYEELIKAGANFASSPKRINIHALDPAIIAAKMSLSDTTKDIDLKAILDNTKYGSAGMGGIKTKGTMYVGYPR